MGLQPIVLKFLDIILVYSYISAISIVSIVVRGAIGFAPTMPFISYI